MNNKKLSIGILGCGGISRWLYVRVLTELCDIAQVVAVCDLEENLAEERKLMFQNAYLEKHLENERLILQSTSSEDLETFAFKSLAAKESASSEITVYSDYDEMLKNDDIDVIFVLTPPNFRSQPVVDCLEAGKHVFSEGPMDPTVEGANLIWDKVQKSKLKYHSQCQDRFTRGVNIARKTVNKALGSIISARIEMHGFRDNSYYEAGGGSGKGWHGSFATEGGGCVYHHGRYQIEPFLYIIDSPIKEVFAYSKARFRNIEVDNITDALLLFENGAIGTVHASLLDRKLKDHANRGRIEVQGEHGGLLYLGGIMEQGNTGADVSISPNSTPESIKKFEDISKQFSHIPEFVAESYQTRVFLESILENKPFFEPANVPMNHVELTWAIYKSAATKQPVTLPIKLGDDFYKGAPKGFDLSKC